MQPTSQKHTTLLLLVYKAKRTVKFFPVHHIFMFSRIIPRAGLNSFAGLIRPPGRMFDTPALETSLNQVVKHINPFNQKQALIM